LTSHSAREKHTVPVVMKRWISGPLMQSTAVEVNFASELTCACVVSLPSDLLR